MTVMGPAQGPPSKDELIRLLKDPLKKCIDEDVGDDSDQNKVYQYSNARRNYLMYRGFQWLARGWNGQVADWNPVGMGTAGGGLSGGGDQNCYSYHNNIFRGNGRKFIAVIGQRAPNTTAVADDPDSERGERAAKSAEKLNSILDSWWEIDERCTEIAEIIWTMGPAFIYTPWNADGNLYGYREEPVYDTAQVPVGEPSFQCVQCGAQNPPDEAGNCPQCGTPMSGAEDPEAIDVPKVTGTEKYANGRVECHIESVLYVSTPFYTRDLKRCPWLRYEKEEHRGVLLKAFPQVRGKIEGEGPATTGTSAIGRQARDSVLSQTGTSPQNSNTRWTFTRLWFNPVMYETVAAKDTREMLTENFPDGLKITLVNGEIVDLEHERLDHVWAVVKPEAGEGINIDPLGQDLVSPQLATNQTLNIGMESFERGIPVTLADPRVWDFTQMQRRQSRPAEFIPAMPAVGDSLASSFFQTQPARFSDQQMPFMESFIRSATENVGITPILFGGGNASTAREAEIQKNAAIGGLGTTWTNFRKGWERAKMNGARQLAKHGPATVQEGQMVVEMAEVLEGNWHFVSDEAIPSTWGQQRDLLLFMMERPQAFEAWGGGHPDNIAHAQKLLGMSNWYTPGLDEVAAIRETITELLKGEPIQTPQPDGSTDTKPSIPIDDFVDNAAFAVQVVQAWAQSEVGRLTKQSNPGGFANVLAYGRAQKQASQPPPPPPPPVVPKVSVSVNSKDLAPAQTQAILSDVNLQVPQAPPPITPAGQGALLPPGAPPAVAGGPTIQ